MSHYAKSPRRARSMMLVSGLAASTIFLTGIVSSAEPITVVSWGGSYGAAQDAALFTDAAKTQVLR